jgi:ribonuclease R
MVYVGEHTRKVYHIGDEVKVKVEKVSVVNREIDFVILDHKPTT